MWIFPLGAAAIALVFGALLVRQFIRRQRAYQLLWAVALLMYAVASLALFLGVIDGWTKAEYRAYWLFGAVLNVPFLAMGELYLLVRKRWVNHGLLLLLLFATAFATARVRTSVIDGSALAKDLPLGKDAFARDTLPYRLSQLYAYPAYVLLLVGSVWSIWKMRAVPALLDRMVGTILIATGATVVAIGSGVGAGLNVVPVFSIGLLAGIAVMFWGFLRASRPVPVADTAPPAAEPVS
ncbi:MAG TPA: hypothetical protein VF984_00530 [Actinomycetota bacterium]